MVCGVLALACATAVVGLDHYWVIVGLRAGNTITIEELAELTDSFTSVTAVSAATTATRDDSDIRGLGEVLARTREHQLWNVFATRKRIPILRSHSRVD